MNSLKDKVAFITGAASKRGMGHAIALRLAREGANIAVVDKFAAPRSLFPGDEGWGGLNAVVSEVESLGKKALAVAADINKSREVEAAITEALKKFGKVDILVHCAAIRGPVTTPIVELAEEDWRRVNRHREENGGDGTDDQKGKRRSGERGEEKDIKRR